MTVQTKMWMPLVALGAMACTEVKSAEVTTAGMYLDYTVVTQGEGTGSDVSTMLRVGGATSTTYVDLSAGDQLSVLVEEEEAVLNQLSLGVVHSYQQRFETDTEDGEFVLRFDRVDQTGAPSSLAVLPAPFEITLPVDDDTVSRSVETGELVVSWDNQSDDSINISVYGDCFASYFALEQSDAGTHTIPLSYFKDNEYDAVSSCSAEVSVERRRTGSVDSEFAGGSSQGVQLRTVTIQMEP
tara:strand:+ start:186 stop:908 length:723 start_codon:yes stop_codon:yes gene_type:complete